LDTLYLGPCLYSKSTRNPQFSNRTPEIFQN
jgi:hypothetical protein